MRLELTRRGDYAVRAMLALARVPAIEPLSARRIAADQSIPARFLPHVLRDLVRAGLITGVPGRSGGYILARPAAEIAILDVVEASEGGGDRDAAICVLRGGPCRPDGRCAVHDVFADAREALRERLARSTLADVTGLGSGGRS
jgi:Rrf2 family protein